MNKKYMISILGLMEILIGYLGFCVSTISYKSEGFIYLAVVLFAITGIGYYIIFEKTYEYLPVYFHQIHVFNLTVLFLSICILLGDMQNIHFPGYRKIIVIMYGLTCIGCEMFYAIKEGAFFKRINRENVEKLLYDKMELIGVIILFILFSIYYGGTPYKWDSNLYYITCGDLDVFSISDLAIYGHIAQAFGLIVKIGTAVFGSVAMAAYLMNVIVAISGIISFYSILRYIYPQAKRMELFLATGVYAFSAYVLGLVNYLTLDYYCACLFPVVVYFMLVKKWVFHIGAAFLFCFTKEPAIIIYAGLCFAYVLGKELPLLKRDGKIRIKDILLTIPYWYMLLIGGLWYATYWLLGPWSAGEGGLIFNTSYIWEKFKVMYIMNFGWFFSGLCVVALLSCIYERKKKYYGIYCYIMIPLVGFSLFSFLFQTANHYRYNAIVLYALCVISMIFVLGWNKEIARKIILIISCIISVCSVFTSIDPVTKYLLPTVFTGNGYMWSTGDNFRLADSAIYNKQMLWAENALNLAFRDSIANEDMIIIQAQNENIWYADGLTEYSKLDDEVYAYTLFWNPDLKQRVNYETSETDKVVMAQVKGMDGIHQIADESPYVQTYSYIAISDENNEVFKNIGKRYSVLEEKEYQYANWKYKRIRFH